MFHAAEIDACDFVVRCAHFLAAHRGLAGTKVDGWAIYGEPVYPRGWAGPIAPEGEWELWFTLPPSVSQGPVADISRALKLARGHRAYCISEDRWESDNARLGRHSRRGWRHHPTTGYSAVSMALLRKPAELVLAGFDAVAPNAAGWGDPSGLPWLIQSNTSGDSHDFLAEKTCLGELADSQKWNGEAVETRTTWLSRPEVPRA
jgi:hypothetical protein